MSLYELSNDLVTVINGGMVVDEETGEVTFDSDNLEELELAFNEKVESVALFIKNLEAESKAMRHEEAQLKARREAKENKAARLKDYLLSCLEQTGTKCVDTTKARVSTRKSKYVEVTNAQKLAQEFIKVKTTETVDKAAIKKAIESGEEVNGAELLERCSLQLR